jgi:hypothetical protein
MGGSCSRHGRGEKCIKFYSENMKGKPRRRLEDNIKMAITETGCVEWINPAQDKG